MAKRFKKKNNQKKTIIGLLSIILASILILGVSFAFFSDYITTNIIGTAGTVKLKPSTLLINSSTDPITDWKPGDVTTLEWTVENAGNKSVYTKSTLEIAWNTEEDIKELGSIYLYPNDMTDVEIRNDISNGGENSIHIGDDQNTIKIDTNTTKGYLYTFWGNVLDGIGTAAEIGDAKTPDSNMSNLPPQTSSQTINFKLAFSLNATVNLSDLPVYVNVTSECWQFRNNPATDREMFFDVSKVEKEDLILFLDASRNSSFSSSKIWHDLSGNGNNFILHNSPIIANDAVEFNGINQYARSENKLDLTKYDSVTVDVRLRSNDTTKIGMIYEHTYNWNANEGALGLAIHCNGNGVTLNLHHTNHNSELARNYVANINTNWSTHVDIFSKIESPTGRLTYVNGVPVSYVTEGGYQTSTQTTANGKFANDYMFLSSRGGMQTYFCGQIQSIRIYGRELTQEEITNNYNVDKAKFELP